MASLFQGVDHAILYSQFRPSPPTALIDKIIAYVKYGLTKPLQNAVDVGCGSGQSTIVLAPYFKHVTGIDVSEAQIQQAKKLRSSTIVHYGVGCGENLPFSDSTVDLVTASQSIHWLNLDKFFQEVDRILVPKGVLAVYTYWIPLPQLEDPVKTKKLNELIVDHFHDGVLEKYWSKERSIVRGLYADIHLPFHDCIRDVRIIQRSSSSVSDYISYLSTWSPYRLLLKENPDKAQEVLEDIKLRMMMILDVKTSPEETVFDMESEFALHMGRKI